MSKIPKIITAEEAARFVQSGMTLAVNSFGALVSPDFLLAALEKRYLETGEPRDLTLWNTLGGSRGAGIGTERLGHDGFLKKAVISHFATTPILVTGTIEEKFESYNLPMGVMSHLVRAAAGRKPGIVTTVGLKTFSDPRYGGGRMNARAKDNWSQVIVIDGEEYLFYKAPKFDICFIRGTTADPHGNITMEREVAFLDILSFAQATKANNGIVICQVARTDARMSHPQRIKVPGFFIDYLVLDPDQKSNRMETYNPAYTGEHVYPKDQVTEHCLKLLAASKGGTAAVRRYEDWTIVRRAAMELKPDCFINLGVGMPEIVGTVAGQEGVFDELRMSVETGALGGMPAPGVAFGTAINPEAVIEQGFVFDTYDGGALDLAVVGAAEIDKDGSVNVGRFGKAIGGVGGFANITQYVKQVVFVTPFTAGKDLDVSFAGGALRIHGEGKTRKFKNEISQVNFSGELARKHRRNVLYITERCVFAMRPEGLTLTEIAPGVDLEKDIFGQMDFRPLVAEDLKIMDMRIFTGESLGLKDKIAAMKEAS